MSDYPKIELGQLTTTINGLWTGKKPPFKTVAVIRNTNFSKDCRLKMDDVAIIDVEERQFATRKLQVGDIIIEKSGGSDKQPVGRPVLFNIPEGDYSFSNFTSTLRVNDKSKVLPAYLHKFLYKFYLSGKTAEMQSKTTGLRNLDFNSYRKILIPVPDIDAQKRIVDELDLLSGIIDSKNAQLRDLDALAQSIFYEMFGNIIANEKKWPFGRFADICAPRSSIKRASKSYLPSDSIEYIDISSIDNKRQKLTGTTAFIFSDAPSRAQQVVQYKDVLISMVRPNLKNIAVVDLDHNRLVASSGFCVLRANNRSNSSFIKSFIGTDAFTQHLMDRVTGANYPAVKEDDIKGCRIGVPPVDLQRQFAERVAVLERQKQLISSAIDEVGNLLSGRMDLYFNE